MSSGVVQVMIRNCIIELGFDQVSQDISQESTPSVEADGGISVTILWMKTTLELSATIRAQPQRFRKWKKHLSRTVTKVWMDSQTQHLLIDGRTETISATPEPESLPRSYEYAAKTTRCKYFILR